MFYTKHISLWELGEKEIGGGVTVNGELVKLKETRADVQPYPKASAYYDYGLDIEVSNAIFMDPVIEVIPGKTVVKYKENYYDVVEVLEWDDYLELLVNRRR